MILPTLQAVPVAVRQFHGLGTSPWKARLGHVNIQVHQVFEVISHLPFLAQALGMGIPLQITHPDPLITHAQQIRETISNLLSSAQAQGMDTLLRIGYLDHWIIAVLRIQEAIGNVLSLAQAQGIRALARRVYLGLVQKCRNALVAQVALPHRGGSIELPRGSRQWQRLLSCRHGLSADSLARNRLQGTRWQQVIPIADFQVHLSKF